MKQVICVNFLNYLPISSIHDAQILTFDGVAADHFAELSLPDQCDCIFVNGPELTWLQQAKAKFPQAVFGLVTDQPMHKYHQVLDYKTASFFNHIFHQNTSLTPTLLASTFAKIKNANYFGSQKYFGEDYQLTDFTLTNTSERQDINCQVHDKTLQCGLHEQQARNLKSICEELLTNAMFDAPVAAGILSPEEHGKERSYADKPIEVSLGHNQHYISLAVQDPFGSFSKEKFFEYTQKILKRHNREDLLDHKVGGAGLGILKILFYSHALIVNVKPSECTEVIAILDKKQALHDFSKQPRSLSYFSSDSAN